MKPNKSPENTEVTPSKKKLKQARLPFMLISDVSPKPADQQTRKRKLSTPHSEPVTKINKLSKENDLTDDLVVISDDECKDEQETQKVDKSMNPFVKLVDNAWKKKQQKSKKKKTNKKRSKETLNHTNSINGVVSECDEKMDVDVPSDNNEAASTDTQTPKKGSPTKESNISKHIESQNASKKNEKMEIISEIIDLEASNDSNVQSVVGNIETENKSKIVENDKIKSGEKDPKQYTSVSHSNEKDIDSDKGAEKSDDSDNNDTTESDMKEKKPKMTHKNNDLETSIHRLTPKRSARNKSILEEKNESNTSISKMNESVSSAVSTPKRSRSSSATNSQGNESMNDSTANLTPKQLQKRLESAKKREEREKEKQEREKKKQQEKEEKAKQRLEKEEQRKKEKEEKEEAKKKEKNEKEEQKKKEKEEKEKQKELEKKLKEEKEDQKRKEREEKEEQRKKEKEAKEEEKRKKQEALVLEKQEQELKKKKAAEAFVNFFVPKQKVDKDQASDGPVSKNSMLSSFTIKGDMRLAPTVRVYLTDNKRQALDNLMEEQNVEVLYLQNLKDGVNKPMSSGRTWPMDDKDDDDVMIVEDELPLTGAGEIITCEPAVRETLHPKLLSFHENRRPPYWGTWRKKSAFVTPRKPFGQDEKLLDYEVDSDDDWEEEQEGESIDGSAAGSDDEQDADEYEVDNEVFVPHGYLSDEEATMGEDDVLSFSPETQKARLKHLEDEFESEMKKPTEKIKPRLYGLLWEKSDGRKPEHCIDALWNYFGKLAMIMNDPSTLLVPSKEPEESDKKKVKKKKSQKKEGEGESESPKVEKKTKLKAEKKDSKPKADAKKNTPDVKKNQPGINSFLTILNQHK